MTKTENKDTAIATMTGNKFATVLARNISKILVILAPAFLEWVMIILLLSNSCFAYLIRKFSAYFSLKPPCPWCARVDHLLEPVKSADPYKALICETHGSQISKLTYCSNHQKLAESETMCEECFSSRPKYSPKTSRCSRCSCCENVSGTMPHHSHNAPLSGSLDKKERVQVKDELIECKANDGETHNGSECEHQVLSDVSSFYLREAAEDSYEDEETESCNVEERDCGEREVSEGNEEDTKIGRIEQNQVAFTELENHAGGKQIENATKEEGTFPTETIDHCFVSSDNTALIKADEPLDVTFVSQTDSCNFTIQRLRCDLEAERKSRNDLYAELEAEINAAAIAANQTMAMITRLQEEKAAMQMEARHYQRVMEEQAEYDQEALQLMNELAMKREREKKELEEELDVYRERVSDYEAKNKAMMMIKECANEDFSSPCSVDSDSDVLSIDLNRHYDNDENGKEISLLDCSNEWGAIDDSLQELEEERLSIIKQLKELEEKLEPNSELCSQEVNVVLSCFSTGEISESHPKTMASAARKLLDFVESGDDEAEAEEITSNIELENGSKRLAIEKEMDHVYGRLQALEADTEFLRHCIRSVNKGNTGVNLLQEILQHLRELRAAEICM